MMGKRVIEDDDRDFKGVWIPAEFWLDENLSIREVVMITEIDSLSKGSKGCFASNSHLAKFLGITPGRVSQMISRLVKVGRLLAKYDRLPTGEVKSRHLWVVRKLNRGIEKIDRGYLENCEGSNTTSNTKPSSHKSEIYDDDSPYLILAKFLNKKIHENNPKAKKPNLQKWADDMRKIVELDKRDKHDVSLVIAWCQKDDFWSTNILSPSKLRKQFDRLYMKMQKEATKPNSSEQPLTGEAKRAAEEAKAIAEGLAQKKENSAKERNGTNER